MDQNEEHPALCKDKGKLTTKIVANFGQAKVSDSSGQTFGRQQSFKVDVLGNEES